MKPAVHEAEPGRFRAYRLFATAPLASPPGSPLVRCSGLDHSNFPATAAEDGTRQVVQECIDGEELHSPSPTAAHAMVRHKEESSRNRGAGIDGRGGKCRG